MHYNHVAVEIAVSVQLHIVTLEQFPVYMKLLSVSVHQVTISTLPERDVPVMKLCVYLPTSSLSVEKPISVREALRSYLFPWAGLCFWEQVYYHRVAFCFCGRHLLLFKKSRSCTTLVFLCVSSLSLWGTSHRVVCKGSVYRMERALSILF